VKSSRSRPDFSRDLFGQLGADRLREHVQHLDGGKLTGLPCARASIVSAHLHSSARQLASHAFSNVGAEPLLDDAEQGVPLGCEAFHGG